MKKIDYFNKELQYINDNNKRKDLSILINGLPDYFFEIPASSTGKYHPEYALTKHGLVKHTKVAVRIAYELLNNPGLYNFKDNEKDIILIALILHDGLKSGKVQEKYTRFDHPLLIKEYILENKNKLSLTYEELELLTSTISAHMGIWSTDYFGNEILPKPTNEYQKFVHMCDYLASRKVINVTFEGIDIKD